MDSSCCKLMRSCLVLPFTAGIYHRRQNGSWYHDCTISSRVLFLVVLSIVIVFTACKRIPTHSEIRLGIVLILLTILMISAIAGFSILGYLVHKHGYQYVVAARRNTSTPKLRLVFLWMFGLGSVFYCAFCIGKQIECSLLTNGGNLWFILLNFNFIVIIGLFSQMVIITYFSPYNLKRTKTVNYAMSMILVANICMYVYGILIGDTFSYIVHVYPGSDLAKCLKNNSTISVLLEKSKPFLRQNFTEFSLMSCSILLAVWSPTQVNVPHQETTHVQTNEIQDTESTRLLPNVAETEHRLIRSRGRRTASQMITLICSITTGLGFLLCYVVMAMDIGNIDNMRHVAAIYRQVFLVVGLLAIFIGFFCLVQYCTPDSSAKGIKPREYVYLLSAFGVFMIHICEGIGGDVSSDRFGYMSIITGALSTLGAYLQVVFLLYAKRCKKSNPRSNLKLLESVLIFLMITNFIFWVLDSFFLSEFPITRILQHDGIPKEYLDFVFNVLLPLCVFFRFTSFLEYYATFEKYNRETEMEI